MLIRRHDIQIVYILILYSFGFFSVLGKRNNPWLTWDPNTVPTQPAVTGGSNDNTTVARGSGVKPLLDGVPVTDTDSASLNPSSPESTESRDGILTELNKDEHEHDGDKKDDKKKHKEDDMSKLGNVAYCKFQANKYRCKGERTVNRYYYDTLLQQCTTFDYGFCSNSHNTFSSRSSCRSSCAEDGPSPIISSYTSNIFCHFQPDFGDCNSYHPMWYFDVSELRCRGFSYSGCGGNSNRFGSSMECTTICGAVVKNE